MFFYAQTSDIKLNAEKVRTYSPYMAARHGGVEGLEQFKTNHKIEYVGEMWYFTESFYIKRNHLSTGATMDESMIDVTRLEQYRKTNEDATVELPGFKDAVILLASKKLLFKPSY